MTERCRQNIRKGLEQAQYFTATIGGKLKDEKELLELIERAATKLAEIPPE